MKVALLMIVKGLAHVYTDGTPYESLCLSTYHGRETVFGHAMWILQSVYCIDDYI